MNITSAAQSLIEAQVIFDRAWDKYFNGIETLSRARFWEMVPYLVGNLEYGQKKLNSDNACREFFRKSEYDERYSFEEAVRFTKTWQVYKSDLYDSKAFGQINFGKSDDSYGDLIDGLPLAGGEFVGRCLVGDFEGNTDFVESLKKVTSLAKHIYNGENYFGMFLEDYAKEYFLYNVQGKREHPVV
jgi:hypothetical protein